MRFYELNAYNRPSGAPTLGTNLSAITPRFHDAGTHSLLVSQMGKLRLSEVNSFLKITELTRSGSWLKCTASGPHSVYTFPSYDVVTLKSKLEYPGSDVLESCYRVVPMFGVEIKVENTDREHK